MENYINILIRALLNNNAISETFNDFLEPYFEIVEKYTLEEILVGNKFDEMKKEFEILYDFSKYRLPENNNLKFILNKLVYSINMHIKEDSKKDVLLLPLIIYLDSDNILSTELFIKYKPSERIVNFCLELLKKINIIIKTPSDLPNYDHEVKMIGKYNSNSSIHEKYKLIDSLERGGIFPYNHSLEVLSFILFHNSFNEYIEILNTKKDSIEIILLINHLSTSEKIKSAAESENFFVKFEIVRQLTYFEKKEININLLLDISKIIIGISSDSEQWKEFINYYVEFPSRSPNFFMALGFVLSQISPNALIVILEELKISNYFSGESINAINRCFNNENLENIKDNIKIVYYRWIQYIETTQDNIMKLTFTDLINIVIFYVMNVMKEDEYDIRYKDCILSISEINNTWFDDKTELLSFYYRQLSILFVLGFRRDKTSKENLLDSLKNSFLFDEESHELIKHNWNLI